MPKSELTGFAAQCDSEAPEDMMQHYYEEMSINEIMNGDETFPSLILLVWPRQVSGTYEQQA